MSKKTYNDSIIVFTPILLGCIGIASVMVLDGMYWKTHVIAERLPDYSPGHLFRSIVLFISTLAIFRGMIGSKKPKLRFFESNGLKFESLTVVSILTFNIILVFLFLFKTSVFNTLSIEDGPIEWMSFVLLFSSSIVTAFSFSMSRQTYGKSMLTRFSLATLTLIFFIIAMEEVSWFQRVLELDTPYYFKENIQNEINFHNFATNHIENIYYFGVFLFLVAAPFIRLLLPHLASNSYLSIILPRPFISVIASIACAYNFDMWNIIFTQVAFFSSIVILYAYATFCSDKKERYIFLFTIFVVIATQVLFLTYSENFARTAVVTEYKELFIPIALFAYTLGLLVNTRRLYVSN